MKWTAGALIYVNKNINIYPKPVILLLIKNILKLVGVYIFYICCLCIGKQGEFMFTIGIFSTHLPYIAFVVFYAYFLIFGVEKASNGEITIGEQHFKSEILLSNSEVNISIDSHYFYHQVNGVSAPVYHDPFIFKRKVNYPRMYSSGNPHFFYSNSLFNRPPPVMV